jgi:hypothetical protein
MVCILGFSARSRGPDNQPISGPRRDFHVGERVRYVASYFKNTPADNQGTAQIRVRISFKTG